MQLHVNNQWCYFLRKAFQKPHKRLLSLGFITVAFHSPLNNDNA